MDQVGVKNHSFNRAKYIHSLTKYGFLTNTEKSKNSSIQKYQTTEAGKRLLNLTNNLPPQ